MKNLLKLSLVIAILFSFFNPNISVYSADSINELNLKTWNDASENSATKQNDYLNSLYNEEQDLNVSIGWEKWIVNSLVRIARDVKNVFFIIAWIYFLILVLRLLFWDNTEEESNTFKKWLIWISVWIIVTQIAYYFINILFDKNINTDLANNFIDVIIEPFIYFLQTAASFVFISIMILSFFMIITANWDEEKINKWKMNVLYSIVWFIIIKISNTLVASVYWKTTCPNITNVNCSIETNTEWVAWIIIKLINWMNWFVWIILIIMVLYAGFNVLTSAWDEEKLKKAKTSILYIAIWLAILIASYLILTFFLIPESTI